MRTVFTEDGWDDYAYWSITDRKMLSRANKLIPEIKRQPFSGIGKPEPLKYDASGCWSRRITDEHRLVYEINGDDLVIIQARFHYQK